jgi:hypothetical protein
MNEMVCLIAAIPVPINSSTVIVQTQDPWMVNHSRRNGDRADIR